MSRRLVFAIALFAAAATGCSASSKYMKEIQGGASPKATPDQATVVFVRHSGLARGIRTTILDERGEFVGDALAHGAFARQYPAGRHLFITWAENTDVLQAELQPGKIYYVEVDPSMGAFSARMHLFAIKPNTESWKDLKDWLGESTWFDVDVPGGRAEMQSRSEDVAERLKRANEHLQEYSGEDLEKRTLRAGDGT